MSNTPIQPQTRTLIIPFAASNEAGCRACWPQLRLPHLSRWLAGARLQTTDQGSAYWLSPPHERALAQAMGWPARADGTLPWASWHAQRAGVSCAWFTPCHWQTGMEQVLLQALDPANWSEAESKALLAALAGDWAAWAQAWQALDAGPLANALQTPHLALVLCGERNAVQWTPAPPPRGWRALWPRQRRQPALASVLEAL